MIPLKEFIVLWEAVPKARITAPSNGVSFIVDTKGDLIGELNYKTSTIAIYDEYEYADQVRQAIGEQRFEHPDIGEQIYSEPKG